MKLETLFRTMVTLAGIAAVALSAMPVLAGTPLTCFPFQIGKAPSLPWGTSTNQDDWNVPKSDYDTRRLASDTIALLGETTPVIVRMETIRRATLYGQRDRAAAADLRSSLEARALGGKERGSNALYLFDYGYLLETYKQAALLHDNLKKVSIGAAPSGYDYVLQALARQPNDPEMEFAAALIASWPRQENYQEHYRKASAGASRDQLLAANFHNHLR